MEATEVINPNGSVERTITLNEEESQAALSNLSPGIRAMVEERLGQSVESLPAATRISAEELERICDEAVGIAAPTVPNEIDTTAITPENGSIGWNPEPVEISRTGITDEEYDEIIPELGISEDGIILDPDPNPLVNMQEETPNEPEEPHTTTLADLNTSLVMDNHSRFSSAEWFDIIGETEVLVGGAGGISSWLSTLLSRTNVKSIFMYDYDKVETANLSGQFFGVDDVGLYKVEAVARRIRTMSDFYSVSYTKEPYTRDSMAWDVMMCGFDNMSARKIFFDKWRQHLRGHLNPSQCLLVDGRLSAETLQVYCIQGDDTQAIHEYMEHCLFSDDEADHTVCSYKQTSFMANMIAGTMVNLFVNWCANRAGGFRPVPFFTEYDAVTMQYKIKMSAV